MSEQMLSSIAEFRAKLDAGQSCVGAAISFADPLVSDALSGSVDFLWIDLEHCAMSPGAVAGHLLAARARGVAALVRVAGSETAFIKPILDAGAEGIIVPQVRSAAEVRQVLGDCRYPPLGQRGFGPRVPSDYGRDAGPDYVERANRDLFVAVQIENAEGLAALDEIISVPGLDSLCLGPWDLSGALGHLGEVEHPDVVAAIETVISKARAAGLYVGSGMGSDPDYALLMIRRGVQWVQTGADYNYLVERMDQIVGNIRSSS